MNKSQIKAKHRRRDIREQMKRSRYGHIRTWGEFLEDNKRRERLAKSLKG